MFIISTTIWVNGWDTSSVASRARSELTSSQCNWKGNRKGKGTDETPLSSFLSTSKDCPCNRLVSQSSELFLSSKYLWKSRKFLKTKHSKHTEGGISWEWGD